MITDVFKMPKGKLHKPLALGEAKCYSTGSSVALQSLPDPALTELTHTVIHTYIHVHFQSPIILSHNSQTRNKSASDNTQHKHKMITQQHIINSINV